jgi:hypothetical protein
MQIMPKSERNVAVPRIETYQFLQAVLQAPSARSPQDAPVGTIPIAFQASRFVGCLSRIVQASNWKDLS